MEHVIRAAACISVISATHGADATYLRAPPPPAAGVGIMPTGDIYVHDPSGMIREGNSWYMYSTGLAANEQIASHVSDDGGYTWRKGSPVFNGAPAWVRNRVPQNNGDFWAPDIELINGVYHLYYAVSSFGSQTSCIGLATTPSLNPANASHAWTDQGPVICSTNALNYNDIDPHVYVENGGNRAFMNFGSFWSGIQLTELTNTGAPGYIVKTPIGNPQHIATHNDAEKTCEASWVEYCTATGWYYLFDNWGYCCRGVQSTYSIVVGRSKNPMGPFLDANGTDMAAGGGTTILDTQGRYIGPGQIGFAKPVANPANQTVTFHYYDRDGTPAGQHTLGIRFLTFSADGWPVISAPP